MALPPEPIDEILPLAEFCVLAEITAIKERGHQAEIPKQPTPDTVDIARQLPYQIVTIKIKQDIFGKLAPLGQEIDIYKPPGDYFLRAGIEGYFLLHKADQPQPTIIGRYGPDTYSPKALLAAIQRHKRA